jgi:hypothetical protein
MIRRRTAQIPTGSEIFLLMMVGELMTQDFTVESTTMALTKEGMNLEYTARRGFEYTFTNNKS